MKIRKQSFAFCMTIWFMLILATACGTFALPQDENTANQENVPPIASIQNDISSSEDTQASLVEMLTSTVTVVPKPTFTPTITPTSLLPAVASIPPQNLVTTDALAEGLKIIYTETNGMAGETKLWMSNVEQLEKRTLLVAFSHKEGYGPIAKISPDARKLLYGFTPDNVSGSEAHRGVKEIWILDDIENHKQTSFLKTINGFVKWLPDNQQFIYSMNIYDDLGNVETTLHSMAISTLDETAIFSTSNFGFTPVTILDNQTMLYLDKKSGDLTEVKKLDLTSGSTTLLREINIPRPWEGYTISPDNTNLLVLHIDTNSQEKMYNLTSVSLIKDEIKSVLTYPYPEEAKTNPLYRLVPQWLPNNQEILIHFPPQENQPSYLGIINVSTETISQQFFLDNVSFLDKLSGYEDYQTFLMIGSWSPDGRWLTLLQYPRPDREVLLLEVATKKMTRIPSMSSSNWINIIGWIK